jgi:hypothetical protein
VFFADKKLSFEAKKGKFDVLADRKAVFLAEKDTFARNLLTNTTNYRPLL